MLDVGQAELILNLSCSLLDLIQTIPAHKYVLATGSSVFYAMFFGGLAENRAEIKVPDVEPAAFLTLLRYLYCDEILLEADNVLATLYVAKKYIVPHLARACVNFLETSLTARNACLLLSQSRLFEEPELMQRCWELIDAQVCCDAVSAAGDSGRRRGVDNDESFASADRTKEMELRHSGGSGDQEELLQAMQKINITNNTNSSSGHQEIKSL